MKVLWLCNIMLPAFAKENHLSYSQKEGWLTGCFDRITKEQENKTGKKDTVELGICIPVSDSLKGCRQTIQGAVFYGFFEDTAHPEVYDEGLEGQFHAILDDFQPDLVHIFGTEYPHTLAMTRVWGKKDRLLIGIQGLCSAISEVYMAGIPYEEQEARSFRDRVRKDSLKEQQKKFELRAEHEQEALKRTQHISGRTEFDREQTAYLNPQAQYHHLNETMRPEFYGPRWDLNGVRRHSIFLSQGDYPLKGFHFLLEAMPAVVREFPDAKLYVAGNSIIGNVGGRLKKRKLPEQAWITSYGKYLKKLIREGNLEDHVVMLGTLSAQEMVQQYQKSHIFVCPSVMENSANSLCEAMLLGMPVIASRVGGLPSLVENGEEGLLFSVGNVGELSEDIINLMDQDQFACRLGSAAHKEALVRHNPDTNYRRLLEIYHSI